MAARALVIACCLAAAPESRSQEPPPPPQVTLEMPATPLPRLRWGEPVLCGTLTRTEQVPSGQYRLQCLDAEHVCLAAPAHVIGAGGVETNEALARARECGSAAETISARLSAGFKFIPAIAEAPPGWIRDERGRVMQFNFDLHRRIWMGAAYAPVVPGRAPSSENLAHRLRATVGFEVQSPSQSGRTLSRWHILDGELFLGQTAVAATLVRFDLSNAFETPVLWVTTFVGEPRRFDVELDLGLWSEALHYESNRRGDQTTSFLTLVAAQPTFDLWHSRDLASYVRVRAGAAVELEPAANSIGVKPQAAVEGDLTLDDDGFHHVRFAAEVEKLFFGRPVEGRPTDPQRLRLRAGYEVIVLAINDYPLTLDLEARGTWRDDLAGAQPGWEWSAIAGLRFSLWAPARRSAPFARERRTPPVPSPQP